MKSTPVKARHQTPAKESVSELLVLPDGRIFAHNISPMMAGVLSELNPTDEAMRERAQSEKQVKHELSD